MSQCQDEASCEVPPAGTSAGSFSCKQTHFGTSTRFETEAQGKLRNGLLICKLKMTS